MEEMPKRSGVLVVRAWVEGTSACGFRARISGYQGVSPFEQPVATTASIDELCAAVRKWLEELLRAAEAGAAATEDPD